MRFAYCALHSPSLSFIYTLSHFKVILDIRETDINPVTQRDKKRP